MPERTLLNDINDFIDERTNVVYIKKMKDSPDFQDISDKEDQVMAELEKLLAKDPNGASLLEELQENISMTTGVYAKYGYIQGCKDGMRLKTLLG